MTLLSMLCLVLLTIIGALLLKIYLLRRAADEIGREFADRLGTDTNTLIAISSRDRHMRALAGGINSQLR
ncbi:MAG: sensor histidine kinase, partial [Lachnospiraceae bacterium]|nr:sensor histidine kinase [Lachnospiraceae bacterium]